MKNIPIDIEKSKHVQDGREAFESGQPRTPPATDPEAARLWLIGYDLAKQFSELEVLTAVVQ